MECPSGELLSRYADHETTPQESATVERHLPLCPACASTIEQFKDAAQRLAVPADSERRRSGECPSALLLFDFLIGDTDGETAREIDEHLSRCDACLHDLAMISPAPSAALEAAHPGEEARVGRANALIGRLLATSKPASVPTIPSSRRTFFLTAAAFLLVGVLTTLAVLNFFPSADAQRYTLTPRYLEGLTQNVKLQYIENGYVTSPDEQYSIPLDVSLSEEYAQTVVGTRNGIPCQVKRTYREAVDPLLLRQTVTVTRTRNGETVITSEDPGDPSIRHPYAGPPMAAVEENFTFALPSRPVRIGDRWTANGQDLVQAIGKAMRHRLKGIRECAMECTLEKIVPGKEAVIGLHLTYDAEHGKNDFTYNTRGTFAGKLFFSIAEGRVLRVELEGKNIAVTLDPRLCPDTPAEHQGSTTISININYQ